MKTGSLANGDHTYRYISSISDLSRVSLPPPISGAEQAKCESMKRLLIIN